MSKYTYYMALLVIALTPLDAITIVPGLTYGRLAFFLLIGCFFFSTDFLNYKPVKYIKILYAFIIWAFLTSFWSHDIEETMMRTLFLIQYLIIVIILQTVINTPERFRNLCIAWIIGALYIVIQTIRDYLAFGYSARSLYRVDDFGNPNENSFMLCFAVVLFLILNRNNLKNLWVYLILLLAFLGILANGSRTGFIMFVIIIVGLLLSLLNNKKSIALILIPIFTLLSIYIFRNYIPETTYMRFMGIGQDLETGNLASRDKIWKMGYEILLDREYSIFFGTGWGTYALVYQDYTNIYKGSHNFYLNLIFTTGIIGLGIVLYYFTTLFKYIQSIRPRNILFYLLLIIPFISMMTTNWESRRWWFLLGVFIYKLNYFSEKEDNEGIR